MAKLHFVKKAAKDNAVVKKGESYFWWQGYRSPKRYSATRPKPSQLCNNKWATVLAAEEDFQDAVAAATDFAGLREAVDLVTSELTDFASECEEAADAVEENFPGSEQAERIRERSSNIEEFTGELEGIELEDERINCPECDGEKTCPDCEGSKKDGDEDCPECDGSGKCQTCDGTGEDEDALEAAKEELREVCFPDDPF